MNAAAAAVVVPADEASAVDRRVERALRALRISGRRLMEQGGEWCVRRDGRTPLEHALHDGEDYELLFTTDPGGIALVTAKVPTVSVVGTISNEPGVWLRRRDGTREPLAAGGWEHSL